MKADYQYWKEKHISCEPNLKYVKTCESRVAISVRKANGELKKLYQRLRFSDEEREMQDEAIAAYDAEKW